MNISNSGALQLARKLQQAFWIVGLLLAISWLVTSQAYAQSAPLGTTTVLTGPAAPVAAGLQIGLSAEVLFTGTPPAEPTGTVSFFDGGTLLGTARVEIFYPPNAAAPRRIASIAVNGLAVGTHAIKAVYSGDTVFLPSMSFSADVIVGPAPLSLGTSYGGPTATTSGYAQISFTGGGPLCGFTRAAFVPLTGDPASPPAGTAPRGVDFAHGLIDFVTSGCTPGSTLTFVVTTPTELPVRTVYWKYGPTPYDATPHWYAIPATVNGNTVTFTITDGGLGDDDLLANGTIVDQGGPGVANAGGVCPVSAS
jgi:hypothetical protein